VAPIGKDFGHLGTDLGGAEKVNPLIHRSTVTIDIPADSTYYSFPLRSWAIEPQ
jgi:hypothetical protein